MRQEIHETIDLLTGASSVLAFTGAGISTGSGIPDFRGPDGLWKSWRPVYYDEFLASEEARIRHWDYKLAGWQAFSGAVPNPAHRALVDLEHIGRLSTLVTQNIDGLHQDAGQDSGRVVEIHGTNRLIECTGCGRTTDPAPIFEEYARTGSPPVCPCGSPMKPATVSFGQAMPQDKLRVAFEAAENCDLVMAIGSTLEVEPAASIPRSAAARGVPYVIVNLGTTAQDHIATVKIDADVNTCLPEIVEGVRRRIRG